MASAKKDVEISIAEIKLNKVKALQKAGTRTLETRLIYPRPTVAQKATTRALQFEAGAWTNKDKCWTESILFKESIQGDTGLEITLSDIVTDKEIEDALSSGASSFIKVLGNLATDAFGESYLGPFADIPAAVLSKALSGKNQIKIVATATQDISFGQITNLKVGEIATIEVPLISKATIREAKTQPRRSTGGATSYKTVAKKGEQIGSLVLNFRII